MLGFPAITPCDAIERPERIDTGSLIMTGLHRYTILAPIRVVTTQHAERVAAGNRHPIPDDCTISDTSTRILNLILGTDKLSDMWDGVQLPDYV